MLTFLFWVQKCRKTAENIFYTYINLWTTMKFGFQDQLFIKKAKKKSTGCFFVNVGQKRRFQLKFTFSSLSSTLILNAKHVSKVAFEISFLDVFRNQKILEESCHILPQYGATERLRPFLPSMISNTDLCKLKIYISLGIYSFCGISCAKWSTLRLCPHN